MGEIRSARLLQLGLDLLRYGLMYNETEMNYICSNCIAHESHEALLSEEKEEKRVESNNGVLDSKHGIGENG